MNSLTLILSFLSFWRYRATLD